MRIHKRITIKNETNGKDQCKQVFIFASSDGMDDAMIVRKRVLADISNTLYRNGGYKELKVFKDKVLYEKMFGIKLSTLNKVISILNKP